MRLTAPASTITLLVLSSSLISASIYPASFAKGHDSRFGIGTQRHLIIPYGGDSPASALDFNTTKSSANSQEESTSSKLLNTVSAGGAFHSETAFIGTKTRIQTRSPPYGIGEEYREDSTSSLSVATNQKEEEVNVGTSSDEETSTVASITPLRAIPKRNSPLKILFLSSDTGGGHRASAEALANQFQRLYPGTTYDLFDVWTDVETSWPY